MTYIRSIIHQMTDTTLFKRDTVILVIAKGQVHVLCRLVRTTWLRKESKGVREQERNIRKHCVAAPLSRLSIVAHTTTRLPLE